MSSATFSIMIWTVFGIGWLGAGVIAVAVLWEFGKFIRSRSGRDNVEQQRRETPGDDSGATSHPRREGPQCEES